MNTSIAQRLIPLMIVCLMVPTRADAVAYCALRDPVNMIYTLFSEADNYRSNVRTVDRDARASVTEDLPFRIHFNELGRHTLYIAQQGDRPLGYVHARSEVGTWGLTEYVWAISPNLTVRGAKVQRSRDPSLRKLDTNQLIAPIVGLGFPELLELYRTTPELPDNALFREMLRSALKTVFVTTAVWKDEIMAADALLTARKALPEARRVESVEGLFSNHTMAKLSSVGLPQSTAIDRDAVSGYRILDAAGVSQGIAIHTPLRLQDTESSVWWVVDVHGTIRFVGEHDAPNEVLSAAIGVPPEHAENCSNALDLLALEIGLLARSHELMSSHAGT